MSRTHKQHTWAYSCCCYEHVMHSWNQYGQFSETQWHWCLSIRSNCSTHLTVLKASPGAAIYGQDMLFDFPFIANWKKIGEHRQQLTDLNTAWENDGRIDYYYQVGQKVLVQNNGILCKAEARYLKEPWMITSVHMNGTIRVQCGNTSERMNIQSQRVKPFVEE